MNRRTFGRGRAIAAIGAIVVLAAFLFGWGRTLGGGLPPITIGALEGAGLVVFIMAIAVLALVTLPYAAGDQPIGIDRTLSFAVLLVIGLLGFGWRILQLLQKGVLGLPDRSPGLWLAGAGLLIVLWGVIDIATERRDR